MLTKPWTYRRVSGSVLAMIGFCILLVTETAIRLTTDKPPLLAATVQLLLAGSGLVYTVVGLYRVSTNEKTPPQSFSLKYWGIFATFVVIFVFCVYFFAPNRDKRNEVNWLQIDSNASGNSLYIGRIERTGNLVAFLTKVNFAVPRTIGNYQVTVLYDRFVANCAEKLISRKAAAGISTTGQEIQFPVFSPQEQAFLPLPADARHPDSISFRHVCGSA